MKDWFLFMIMMESAVITIFKPAYFNYGVGEIAFILISLFVNIFAIPNYK